jgi:hypothetical protein
MSNEVGEPGGAAAHPIPGAVRFGDDGGLEIYGADGWQPLVRVPDTNLPPITRLYRPTAESAAAEPKAEADDSGDADPQAAP